MLSGISQAQSLHRLTLVVRHPGVAAQEGRLDPQYSAT
jgi:hypothetical protein